MSAICLGLNVFTIACAMPTWHGFSDFNELRRGGGQDVQSEAAGWYDGIERPAVAHVQGDKAPSGHRHLHICQKQIRMET